MNILNPTASADLTGGLPLTPIDEIAFGSSAGATLTFDSSQFGPGLISDTLIVQGDGHQDIITVGMAGVGTFDASGWTFANWNPDLGELVVVHGTVGADTITGSSSRDVIDGSAGADVIDAGGGDDVLPFFTTDVAPGEILNGGAGTDEIDVNNSAIVDFSVAAMTGIEVLKFNGTLATTATLSANQVGSGAIADVIGAIGANSVIVSGTVVDLSQVTFHFWILGTDTITIKGTSLINALTGSSQPDTINASSLASSTNFIAGGGGADTLNGGAGFDIFDYFAASDAAAGEVVNGGSGINMLRLQNAGSIDFTDVALNSIGILQFASGVSTATLKSNQIGSGPIVEVDGSPLADAIVVNGASVNLGNVDFVGWTAGVDSITINGTGAGTDFLFGSGQVETINGGAGTDLIVGRAGADILNGGSGDDRFGYSSGEAVAGEVVDGGDGSDFVFISSGNIDFSAVTLVSIEGLSFSSGLCSASFNGAQLGAGAIDEIRGSLLADSLIVSGAAVDLSALSFTNWTTGSDRITINGTAVDDSLRGSSQNDSFDGGAGDDTAIFSQGLSSYSFSVHGGVLTIVGPDGTDTLTAIEHLRFADGTVDLSDGNDLFDPLFYDLNNPDIFHAGLNALGHYDSAGFHAGLDPDAFFDTSGYLAVNRDVAAAGVNPLTHFDQFGWKEGRDPGPDFDTRLYLLHNADVVAAGIDPLAHFLTIGLAEGRAAFAAIGTLATGFDAEFYLLHNPDVAAAGIDPLLHFNTFGWKEGRNPNLDFDTRAYLAHYADVAAAGINPLQHYEQFGFKEGRDPSAVFDTLGYLAANPDVAAAHLNPLDHFLNLGIYEGRGVINDGIFH